MDDLNNQQLTKRERRLLKRQQQEEERSRLKKRERIKKMVFILLPIFLIIGGIVWAIVGSSSQGISGTPKIEIIPKEYNAGTVSMSDGLVKHIYEVKNIGDGDLKINYMETSCMCTTARLKVGDKEGPEFGMHNNPTFGSQKIAPGETGFLEVTFDPAFHGPQGTGQVTRAVYLSTDDPQNRKATVRLIANVMP